MSEENKDKNDLEKNETENVQADDAVARKLIFSLCYLWGILFFLPLILYPNDSVAKRHANAGLVLLLFSVVGNVVFGILTFIPLLNIIFAIVAGVYSLLLLVLGIVGIVYVVTDQNKDLPLIGAIKFFK